MITIKIYLRKYMNSSSGVVWISFYLNREKINFSTKITVEDKNWSQRKQQVLPGDKKAGDKNLIIESILARINNVLVKYRLRDKKITRDTFLRAFHRPSDYETLFDFIFDYQKKISYRMEMSTFSTHQTVINKLKEYNSVLTFDDIDRDWLDRYFCYLKKDLDNNDNTAYKNMSILKKYIRAAYKEGYLDSNPFEDWSIKRGTSSCVYLSEEELQTLVTLYRNGELDYQLHKTLEFFLFLCFSSLHVGDAKKLQLEQFAENHFTYFRIKLKNSKPVPILVPISEPLRYVLKNLVGDRKKGPIFEKMPADQTMNKQLKDIAIIADIQKNITHKVGRHTFATIYLRKTKDLASLKEILGHSDLKETLIYAHVLDQTKQEGIQCFNSFAF
ncbi:MAG: phage integrase SAM-like domain-containing protein [Bacteroides thetaiotaomicron]